MRYYNLVIADPITGEVYKSNATTDGFNFASVIRGSKITDPNGVTKSAGGSTFTSTSNGSVSGVNIPGALNIEFDISAFPFNTPKGTAWIRVWGIGLGMIGQAADFNPNPFKNRQGASISLSAGMQKGLPLTNPAQAGQILQGNVLQAFGNWQGVNQTLELIVGPPVAQKGQDIMFHWPAGMPLATALSLTFQQGFSKYSTTSIVKIARIVQACDEHGHYESLFQFAGYIAERSMALGAATYGHNYSGVAITVTGNVIYAYDDMNPRQTIQLKFADLIGQPTWINPATVSFKTVMGSDIAIGDRVRFPSEIVAAYALTTAAAAFPNAPSRSKSAFQGTFKVTDTRHVANFRQADADSWVTTFEVVAIPPPNVNLLNSSLAL
jgi:hypothetical protein